MCLSSTVRISFDRSAEALAALRQGLVGDATVAKALADAANLRQALNLLGLECGLCDGDLVQIQYSSGAEDPTGSIWPILAPFVTPGSQIMMARDEDLELTIFENGTFRVVDPDSPEPGAEASDGVLSNHLFSEIRENQLTLAHIDEAMAEVGHLNFTEDPDGPTPVMFLIRNSGLFAVLDDEEEEIEGLLDNRFYELLDCMLETRPDLDHSDEDGETALTLALKYRYPEVARKLLEHGASLAVEGGRNPFEQAAESHHLEAWNLLIRHGGDDDTVRGENCLLKACGCREYAFNKADFVRHLVESIGGVNAACTAHVEVDTGLLRPGATPLVAAVLAGELETVEYLLAQGADPRIADSRGNLPLHYCSGKTWTDADAEISWWPRGDNLEVIKLLTRDVDDVTRDNRNGQSPYSLAKKRNPLALEYFEEMLRQYDRSAPAVSEPSAKTKGFPRPEERVQQEIDQIVASATLRFDKLVDQWTPNQDLTIDAFKQAAAEHSAGIPEEDLKDFLGFLETFSDGSLEAMDDDALGLMRYLMDSVDLRFTDHEMIRTLGSSTSTSSYVIESIEDATLHLTSLRISLGALSRETVKVTFVSDDRIELRYSEGNDEKIEVYDRVK
ncbi:MAG: ankyrin repeat domain-containing protein [Thermoanaerobaculia bacterium]|nr:ankyrin repeat domain-containing protein [Thermoanaerobaculia bacterium]